MWIEGLSPEIFEFVSLGQSTQQVCEMRTSKQGQGMEGSINSRCYLFIYNRLLHK